MIQHWMIPDAVTVRLSPEERAVLEARLRAPTTEQRQVFRARIVLLATEGRSTRSIARELRHDAAHGEWLVRPLRARGSPDWKTGRTPVRRILALLDEPPPKGYDGGGHGRGSFPVAGRRSILARWIRNS
jgi:hypothetical protein